MSTSNGLTSGAQSAIVNLTSNSSGLPSSVRPLTEEDLLSKDSPITPDDVLRLDRFTKGYLCEPEANLFNIDFTRFTIRDMESGVTLFEISKPSPPPAGWSSSGDPI